MPSRWRWCPNCRRWFYPDAPAEPGDQPTPRCPVCQRESVSAEEAPGTPPANGDATR